MLTAEQLAIAAQWPGATNIRACTVKIGRTTYEGFAYDVPEGWGTTDRTPQPRPSWGETRFYLLADSPPPSSRRRVVYRIDRDDGDWYFAGYVTPETAADERYAEFHPLGAHFLLMRWPHERIGGRIDQYDRYHLSPRRRMPIAVDYHGGTN